MTIVLPVLPQLPSSGVVASVSSESVPDVEDETPQETEELSDHESLEDSSENRDPVAGAVCANSDSSHDSATSQVRSEWSVQDTWVCPPFSFEQSEDHMTIVLHVPHVKRATLVTLLEKNMVRSRSMCVHKRAVCLPLTFACTVAILVLCLINYQ